MGTLDRILDRTTPVPMKRAWPVGHGTVYQWEKNWGHDDARFSPEEYGDYLATSNDIYSVAAARARLLSGLDLCFYKGRGTKKKTVDSGRAVDLYGYVNDFWTTRRLAYMDELSMCVWGETYWALEPPSAEHPLGEIWWLKPSKVKPAPDADKYLVGYWYEADTGERIPFTKDEVIWFRYPNPIDEFSALSPLAAARLAADTAASMMKSNRNLFDQGMQIAGLITPPNPDVVFEPDQADDLELYLQSRFTGPDKAHRWAVLRYEAQFKQMSMNPKDAEFISGLNMSFRQVCRAYGMQASLHNDLEQSSPGDTQALERVEWARTLKPDAQFRAEEIREQYLPRFVAEKGAPDHCEFDFSQVPALQESASEVWDRDGQMLDRGLLTINEWRERNGMPPVEWGDHPWLPLNKGQYKDGVLAIPGQNAAMAGGEMGLQGGPQDGVQGGPELTDSKGKPLPKPPDDERNPVNKPERWVDHMQARAFLATFARTPEPTNGHVPARVG